MHHIMFVNLIQFWFSLISFCHSPVVLERPFPWQPQPEIDYFRTAQEFGSFSSPSVTEDTPSLEVILPFTPSTTEISYFSKRYDLLQTLLALKQKQRKILPQRKSHPKTTVVLYRLKSCFSRRTIDQTSFNPLRPHDMLISKKHLPGTKTLLYSVLYKHNI